MAKHQDVKNLVKLTTISGSNHYIEKADWNDIGFRLRRFYKETLAENLFNKPNMTSNQARLYQWLLELPSQTEITISDHDTTMTVVNL